MRITQIVPKLPPAISGVGDYALLLAQELRATHGISSRFILINEDKQVEQTNDFPVCIIPPRAKSLAQSLRGTTHLCLHYVGYGYQKRGYAAWLARGLRTWKQENRNSRLITMFHEIFATGRIWNSSFWLSWLQRWVAGTLANVSDSIVTNRQGYAEILALLAPRSPAAVVIPVLSTIGEPLAVKDYKERKPWLVVFGGNRWAHDALTTHADAVRTICDRLHLDRVIQVGSSINHGFNHLPVDIKGVLPAAEISDILSQSKAGFLNYGPPVGKSTIFAAYCAHAVTPVFPPISNFEVDGVFRGMHYLLPSDLEVTDPVSKASHVAKNAHEWYVSHDIKATAILFAQMLKHG